MLAKLAATARRLTYLDLPLYDVARAAVGNWDLALRAVLRLHALVGRGAVHGDARWRTGALLLNWPIASCCRSLLDHDHG